MKQGPSRAEEAAKRVRGKECNDSMSGGHCPLQDFSLIALIYESLPFDPSHPSDLRSNLTCSCSRMSIHQHCNHQSPIQLSQLGCRFPVYHISGTRPPPHTVHRIWDDPFRLNEERLICLTPLARYDFSTGFASLGASLTYYFS